MVFIKVQKERCTLYGWNFIRAAAVKPTHFNVQLPRIFCIMRSVHLEPPVFAVVKEGLMYDLTTQRSGAKKTKSNFKMSMNLSVPRQTSWSGICYTELTYLFSIV
jgi:hypothetical protein